MSFKPAELPRPTASTPPPPPPPPGGNTRFGSMRAAMTAALALAVAAFTVTMTACAPVTPTSSTPGSGGGGSGGAEPPTAPTPAPEPTPPPPEPMKWTLEAAQFGDDGANIWIETSNRSQPFAWDAITADNADAVRVSIGGVALAGESRSFTSTEYEPAFEGDYSGAEWTISAEVSPGAVALVLTAPHQRIDRGDLRHVEVTNGGNGYGEGNPIITFADPPEGGRRAEGVAVGPGVIVAAGTHGGQVGHSYPTPPVVLVPQPAWLPGSGAEFRVRLGSGGQIVGVDVLNGGSGYWGTSLSCRFDPRTPAYGNANCSVTRRTSITGIELTDRGRGYEAPPDITITRVGANGGGAAARAVLRGPTGNTDVENLFWGRQALYGKELLIEIVAEE